MKKQALSLAIAAAIVAPSALAEGPIDGKVYGKLNVTLDSMDSGSTDQWEVNSNASRLGFKGKTKLNDNGLKAIYKLEYEVFADDGDKGGQTFTQRNIYVGLAGNFGTVMAGRHDSPLKMAQGKIDLFSDLKGDIKNTFEGENRLSNVVMYQTPKMNGFQVTGAFVPGEGDDLDNNGEADDGIADGMSISATYKQDNLYLALATDRDVDDQDAVRLIGQYKMGDLTLGAMYQTNEANDDSKDESGYFLSAAYKVGMAKLKFQYGAIEDDVDNDEEETLSLGADFKLGKKTKTFVYYTKNTDETGAGVETEDKVFGAGIEHKF
ncbi:MAG: porin [Cellvibrionaceae bacterium]